MKTALLFSGGIDSTALLYWKKPDIAILINYGQTCFNGEFRSSKKICKMLKIPLKVIEFDCTSIGLGSLFRKKAISISPTPEWYPFRNQLLITIASIWGIKHGIKRILIGLVKTDCIYKDGSIIFTKTINKLIKNQEGNIQIGSPAIRYSSYNLIKKSKIALDILYWCHSCNANEYACGQCDSCKKTLNLFESLNL